MCLTWPVKHHRPAQTRLSRTTRTTVLLAWRSAILVHSTCWDKWLCSHPIWTLTVPHWIYWTLSALLQVYWILLAPSLIYWTLSAPLLDYWMSVIVSQLCLEYLATTVAAKPPVHAFQLPSLYLGVQFIHFASHHKCCSGIFLPMGNSAIIRTIFAERLGIWQSHHSLGGGLSRYSVHSNVCNFWGFKWG